MNAARRQLLHVAGIAATFLTFLLFTATLCAAAAEPKRVLILYSSSRDFSQWNEYATTIRAELERQSPEHLDIYETSLATAQFVDDLMEAPFVDYLRALLADHRFNLVVAIGNPAASFLQRYRQQLFPSTSMLFTAVEQRRVPNASLTANDAIVAYRVDLREIIANILQVLPETTNVAVVIGSSPVEKFWLEEMRREFEPFTNRLEFTWFNELSFNEMLERAAALPVRSAILFGLLSVDATGAAHEELQALTDLHAVAKAPMFSYVDTYLGRGIVGGPLVSVRDVS